MPINAAANDKQMKETWETAFNEAIVKQAFNTAPVESLVRNISYYLRNLYSDSELHNLHFMEMGSGAGSNLIWLAQKGIKVSGCDIAPTVLELGRQQLIKAGLSDRIGSLTECSVSKTPFPDASFDGIVEACVFQHLNKEDRIKTFNEVKRLLKPGGLFAGYMLDAGHTTYQFKKKEELKDDPGTLMLSDGKSKLYLTNIGLCHFYRKEEFTQLLDGFSIVDPCLTTYYLPKEEALKRGYNEYLQSMWAVYAVK